MKSLATIIAVLMLSSCAVMRYASVPPVLSKDRIIKLPDLPKRVAIQPPGHEQLDPNTKYIKYPHQVKPNATWKASKDGGWIWDGKDLQALIYGLVEPWKWIDKTKAIVDNHNAGILEHRQSETRPWWRIW